MAESAAAQPMNAQELAAIDPGRVADASLVARLMATIRHLAAMSVRVEHGVNAHGQLVLTVKTPMDPRGEQMIVAKGLSLEVALAILKGQGYQQVQAGADAAPRATRDAPREPSEEQDRRHGPE